MPTVSAMTRHFDHHRSKVHFAIDKCGVRMRVVEHYVVYRRMTPTGAVETTEIRTYCALDDGRIVHVQGDEHYIVRDSGERLRRVAC